MLAIQNHNASTPAFKQAESTQTKPYQTCAGLAISGAHAGAAALTGMASTSLVRTAKDVLEKNAATDTVAKEVLDANKEILANASKGALKTIPITIAGILGSGALVNHVINKRQKEFAKELDEYGKEAVLANNKHAELTDKGNVYYHSSVGKKLGTFLGTVVAPALLFANSTIAKVKVPGAAYLTSAIAGTVGGFVLGGLTDYFANKGAKKHADKMGAINQQ